MVQRPPVESPRGFWARASRVARAVATPEVEAVGLFPRVSARTEASLSPPAIVLNDEPLRSEVLTVGALFDGRYRYRLACFQRAYAWRPEHAARLISDIRSAMQSGRRRKYYPLGRLMLAQRPGSDEVEIVDGHQRMITLTMLIAVLRDLEADPARAARLHRLIVDDAMPLGDIPRARLNIQALPARLFADIVQRRGSTELEPGQPRETLSETERNIVDNRDCIRSELLAPGMSGESRRALTEFVLDRCHLINVIADDADDAWEMLNTEEDTRLAFNHADEAKSVILSAMPSVNHVPAARLWESCESILTPQDVYRLLCHIRAMTWRGKSQSARPVETEIVERFGIAADGLSFMIDHLVPHANRLKDVRRGQVGRDDGERMSIARFIDFMTWIDAHGWLPAMLLWMKERGPAAPDTLEFVRRLDGLVWMSKIAGIDPGVQETRLHRVMDEIERGTRARAISALDIEQKIRGDAVFNMRSPNFAAKHYAGCLLRRISATMGSDPGPILRNEVTIEHILPRNPHGCKAWLASFRNPDGCKAHHQRLGNVVLLSGRDNQKAGTRSWEEKREILQNSPFLLAQDAARERTWTAQTIAKRTERLINLVFMGFDLPPLVKGE